MSAARALTNAEHSTLDPIPGRARVRLIVALVLTLVAGVGLWGAVGVTQSLRASQQTKRVETAFEHARYTLAIERSAIRTPGTAQAGRDLRLAKAAFAADMRAIRKDGTGEDRAQAFLLARRHDRLSDAARAAFALASAGAVSYENQRTAFESQASQLDAELTDVLGDVRSRSSASWPAESVQKIELGATGLLIVLGLASCTIFLMRLAGYRRRLERSRRQELARLAQAALSDSLTGLGNHRAFYEDLKAEITRRTRTGSFFSVLMLDLDGLKDVNDTLGHHAGDERIRAVADCLSSERPTGGTYRTGGDEFMVLLPGERAWSALTFAQRLQTRISEHPKHLRVSCGLVESTGLESAATLVQHADVALYDAKRSGRRIVVYSTGLSPKPNRSPEEVVSRRHQQLLAATLAQAVDAKDPDTRNHSETVSALCVLIGQELGLDGERLERLRVAGLLHDVGKIGISDSLLRKRSGLDDIERGAMNSHVFTGRSILSAAGLQEEAAWVYHHHEHVDGSGYPDGSAGSAIPLESRIIRVADAFDAMTAVRPYSSAQPPADAFAELVRGIGTQFDKESVEALGRVLGPEFAVPNRPVVRAEQTHEIDSSETAQVASA